MISRFTHLIYGRSSSEDGDRAPLPDRSDPESALITTSTEENDDWLIVERSDCEFDCVVDDTPEPLDEVAGPSRRLILSSTSTPVKSESSNTSGSEETSDFERFRGPYVSTRDYDPQSDAALSDVSSQPEHVTHPSLEECWIVTPPECFTASESSADTGMHPLENLLIEHPSMSVYWPQDRLLSRESEIERSKDREDEDQGVAPHGYQLVVDFTQIFNYNSPFSIVREQYLGDGSPSDAPPTENSLPNAPPRGVRPPATGGVASNSNSPLGGEYSFLAPRQIRLTANRLGNYLGLFVRGERGTEAEHAGQRLSARVENSRKGLEHQNRVREYASSGKIRQRKDRMGSCPSGRSNNRKC